MKREELNQLFIQLRKENRLTVADVAHKLGYNSYTTISKFEHGKINYSLDFACKYLNCLGRSLRVLNNDKSCTIRSQEDFICLMRDTMISRNLTFKSLAEVLGMTKSVCEYMVNGRRTISIDKFFDCVNALGFYILVPPQ